MNFLPLAIWAIGYLFIATLDEHWNRIDGVGITDKESKSGVELFLGGCAVFIILGFL